MVNEEEVNEKNATKPSSRNTNRNSRSKITCLQDRNMSKSRIAFCAIPCFHYIHIFCCVLTTTEAIVWQTDIRRRIRKKKTTTTTTRQRQQKRTHTNTTHWTESKIKKNIIGQMLISMFRFDVFVAVVAVVVVYGIVPLVLSLDSIIFLHFAFTSVLVPIFVLCLLSLSLFISVYICEIHFYVHDIGKLSWNTEFLTVSFPPLSLG